ncbi:uncharacterized protein DSM5745_10932 [Aspergillus mulundensis]|uniref:Uncharacterized protein n=1 Tax=Aspergillus mulundensis TaxID=1810919 RepID=A0A3D8QGC7_9EURO|nr:Uncharacterized protein DSM5745_10932 [Aspergillus mulundensis]RDW60474.1 Uncharacterized protein DSM5745_10932 [Aspergillus mulundensis]
MACGLTSNATSRPSALSRPKLTLQTSSLPMSFSTSSTGLSLSLATGPTASPTVRNTFKNAYDVAYPPSATASPSRSSNHRFSKPSSPYTSSNPYQLPIGVKSILRNSCLESTKRRSNSVGPSNGSTTRRVFFPTRKQVSYRYPLEEEIKTVKYTARHSDLVSDSESGSCETSSDDDSDYSTSSLVSSDTTPSDEETNTEQSTDKKKKKRKYLSNERQVRAVALMEGLKDPYASQSQTPQTPRQGRLKRRREWRWTLGPLEEAGNSNITDSGSSVSPPPTSNTNTQPPIPSETGENQAPEEPNNPAPNTTVTAPSKPPQSISSPATFPARNDTAMTPLFQNHQIQSPQTPNRPNT